MHRTALVVAGLLSWCGTVGAECGKHYETLHGPFFDLRPLRKELNEGNYKAVNSIDDHDYFLNICAGLNPMDGMSPNCTYNDTHIAGCQDKHDDAGATISGFPKILASTAEEPLMRLIAPDHASQGVVFTMSDGFGNGPTACHGANQRSVEIEFRCTENAGLGSPVFTGETTGCVYTFTWQTEYACLHSTEDLSHVVDCSVINNDGDVVDLTPLARGNSDWQIGHEEYIYHINLCHGLVGTSYTTDCANGQAGACQTGANGMEKSLGTASRPQMRDDDIVLSYTNGTNCSVGARRADIVFHCREDAALGEPVFAGESHEDVGCSYLFQWDTAVVCPPRRSVGSSCQVHDDIDGYTYDLSPLNIPTGYNLSFGTNDNYRGINVNVCGPAPACAGSTAAACTLADNGDARTIGLTSQALAYNHGDLTLRYNTSVSCGDLESTRSTVQVEIAFLCDPNASVASTTSQQRESERHYFEIAAILDGDGHDCNYLLQYETALACPPAETVNCVAQNPDNGDIFDLSPLVKENGAWVVFADDDDAEHMYNLNLCSSAGAACENGNAACQVSRGEGTDMYGLGLPAAPRWSGNGLVVEYVGGHNCHSGAANRHTRSTTINFYCDPAGGLGEPRYISETDCYYMFEWYSSAACALGNETQGSDCTVADPRTGHVFDFSTLGNTTGDYHVVDGDGEFTYYFNICRPARSCNSGRTGAYGACQKKPNFHTKALGNYNGRLEVADDAVHLIYETNKSSDMCSAGSNRAFQINFVCPQTDADEGTHIFLAEFNCTYFIEFRTSLACVSTPLQCAVSEPTGHRVFDLTRLQDNDATDGNWEVRDPESGAIYEVNLCRALVPSTSGNVSCPTYAAACQRSPGRPPVSIGRPSAPQWDDVAGHPYIVYESGQGSCHATAGNYTRRTRIDFLCPSGDTSQSEGLTFERETGDCLYLFIWYTALVCGEGGTDAAEGSTGGDGDTSFSDSDIVTGPGDCRVTDPMSGYTLDFSGFASTQYPEDGRETITDHNGNRYHLSICDPPSNFACGNGAMACQRTAGGDLKSLGGYQDRPAGEVELVNGVGRIRYTGGQICHANTDLTANRSTVIEFHCDPTAGSGFPEFTNESDTCSYYFRWHTAAACFPDYAPFDCSVDDGNGNFYDLSGLSSHTTNWHVSDRSTVTPEGSANAVYEINLCRPVVPAAGMTCNRTAGACQLNAVGSHMSLGQAQPPQIAEDGSLYVEYYGGDACHNGNYHRALRINFECPRDSQNNPLAGVMGSPTFESENEQCRYFFNWRTSAACPLGTTTADANDCKVTSAEGQVFDLNDLKTYGDFDVHAGDFTYKVGICTDVSEGDECHLQAACQIAADGSKKKLGILQPLTITGNSLRLHYVNGTNCHDSQFKRETIIDFRCNRRLDNTEGNSPQLTFVTENGNCSYEFVMETALACVAEAVECSYTDPSTQSNYDLSALQRTDANWIAAIGSTDESASVTDYSYYINVCRNLVPIDNAGECTGGSACQVSNIGEGNHIASVASSMNMTVEHGKLIARYGGGESCSTGERRIIIEFECDADSGNMGRPVFVGEESHCAYKFSWRSSYACPIGGSAAPPPPPPSRTPLTSVNCSVTDQRSGNTYDLSTLGTETGTITAGGSTFHIAACGGTIHHCHGAVCVSTSSGMRDAGKFYNAPHFTGDDVIIDYTGGQDCLNSVVTFKCDWSNPQPAVIFRGMANNDCTYQYEWRTSRVCAGHANLQCVAHDAAGTAYDLSPLGRGIGEANWDIDSSLVFRQGDNKRFVMNVCKQVVQTAEIPADCIDASVCDLSTSRGPGGHHAIGLLEDEPTFLESEGVARIWYPSTTDGVACGTLVEFSCLRGSLGIPSLTAASNNCYYEVSWATSVMCSADEADWANDDNANDYDYDGDRPAQDLPVGPLSYGTDCEVQSAGTGVYFDLRPLRDRGATNVGGGTLAVCGPVTDCGNVAGACTSDGVSWGQYSDRIRYAAGELILDYQDGDDCSDGQTHSTVIRFTCDETPAGTPGRPIVDATLSSDCEHHYHWPTSYACEHIHQAECLTIDPSNNAEYDLSSLIRTNPQTGNWIVLNNDGTDEYVLNVCHELLRDTHLTDGCGNGAALCQLLDQDPTSSGTVGRPLVESGEVLIHMRNGRPCSDGRHREATIHFSCKQDAGLGNPVFRRESSHCVYDIDWATSAACPVTAKRQSGTCNLRNVAGLSYNLHSLMGVHQGQSVGDDNFQFRLCRSEETMPCRGDACVRHGNRGRWFSLGRSAGVRANGRTLAYIFEEGESCPTMPRFKRSGTISFVCGHTAGEDNVLDGPKLSRNDRDCFYSFVWKTPLACAGTPAQCTVFNPFDSHAIYLGQLPSAPPAITNNGNSYYLSICSPREASPCSAGAGRLRRNQQPGTGVCASIGGNPVSLGELEGSLPSIAPDNPTRVYVNYTGGDTCPSSAGSGPASSLIEFICKVGTDLGQPRLLEGPSSRSGHCLYKFQWETCLTCGGQHPCGGRLATTPRPSASGGGGGAGSGSSAHDSGSDGSNGGDGGGGDGSDGSSGSGGAILTIFIVAAVVAGLAFVLKDENRRSWLVSMVPGMASRPSYNYSTVNKGYESELSNGLLYDSDGDEDEDEEELPLGGGNSGAVDSMGMAIRTSDVDLVEDSSNANDEDEEMLPL